MSDDKTIVSDILENEKEFDLEKYSKEEIAKMKTVKHDRRKLRKLDMKLLYTILSEFTGVHPKGSDVQILAIIKGLAENDEFEFHEATQSIREYIANFVSKFLPIPNEATIALERTALEQGAITVYQRRAGRTATKYNWRSG